MPLAEGDLLGHYKIQSMIGRGGMGAVYQALYTAAGTYELLR